MILNKYIKYFILLFLYKMIALMRVFQRHLLVLFQKIKKIKRILSILKYIRVDILFPIITWLVFFWVKFLC